MAKPILKWAGGKTQMLDKILPHVPARYERYIEPFFGGGALFFCLEPTKSIISDSNPELINVYRRVAIDFEGVVAALKSFENTEEMYYRVRSQKWTDLEPSYAAARTIFLNKTCFNGLYRVNKGGDFNVPFGRYKNPTICDEATLRQASESLRRATILCGDYLDVLRENAKKGDFVFLDPPYVPVSKNADFKRYTKRQFGEGDHRRLAKEVERLKSLGCFVLLTNSNTPLVHELFDLYDMAIYKTRRYISCNGAKRSGEDVLVMV